MKKAICLTVFLSLMFCCVWISEAYCQTSSGYSLGVEKEGFYSINEYELSDIVYFLADRPQEGRWAGTFGGYRAGEYIANRLEESDVDSLLPGNYYQNFCYPNKWAAGNVPACLIKGRNVIGTVEGTTKEDEYVFVIAHYDHLGFKEENDKFIYYPGADDNASGTAAVLEIAEAFGILADKGIKSERSVVFALFDAEERGLVGSQYFVKNAPMPLKNIVAVINLDMIGRNDAKTLYVIGTAGMNDYSKNNPQIAKATENANKILGFNISELPPSPYNWISDAGWKKRLFERGSDHASFNWFQNLYLIPVVFYFAGDHPDYHQPTDTADKVDYIKVKRIARLAFLAAWQLSNLEEKPVYIENK